MEGWFAGWRITESFYDKKHNEYRSKQKEVESKIKKLRLADEEYYITADYLVRLASKANELFESSEPMEKRLILKMTLQNPTLEGKKVRYNWIKPFDTIADYASRQAWLPLKDMFINRELELDITLEEIKSFHSTLPQKHSFNHLYAQ
ncbi:MAG TPA: hypothetical protein ENI23_17275 [bacterium]|nr:hypothetical protein [bacterium]